MLGIVEPHYLKREITMKHLTVKALLTVTAISISTIVLAAADSDQWGEWDKQSLIKNGVANSLELNESELLQGDLNVIESVSAFSMGTQLAGEKISGGDTKMDLDEYGVPLDFQTEVVSEAFPLNDLRSEEELGALDSPMVSGPGELEVESGSLLLVSPEGFPDLEIRSEEELGALDSYFVPE